ncbi:MAG TPA: hypothetical protein VE326_11565 [Candidatus Binatia bacterium]|nr:hypothetical protein [Candidatus Binatia bacterium]
MPEDQQDDDANAQQLLDDAIDSDTDGDDEGDSTDWKAEAAKWKAQARKHETRSKENATAKAELERLRKASMSEQEKAVAEAEERGKKAAMSAAAVRLARAELRAAAAGTVDKDALDGFLEYADLSKFIGEDGEPDDKAITAAIKKLGGSQKAPNFDGGARRTAGAAKDMNAYIRERAGIR